MKLVFDYADLARAGKDIAKMFNRVGQNVISQNADTRVRRTAGVSYKEILFTFASGQTATIRVKQTGDVFQVLINGSVFPLKNQDSQSKAVAEVAAFLEKNEPAYQKKMARVKAELPAGTKSAAPKIAEAMNTRLTELDEQIAERKKQVEDLRAELGDAALDSVNSRLMSYVGHEIKDSNDKKLGVITNIEKEGAKTVFTIDDDYEIESSKFSVVADLVRGGKEYIKVEDHGRKIALDSASRDKDLFWVLKDQYGVTPANAPVTAIIWAAGRVWANGGDWKKQLDQINEDRQKKGKPIAYSGDVVKIKDDDAAMDDASTVAGEAVNPELVGIAGNEADPALDEVALDSGQIVMDAEELRCALKAARNAMIWLEDHPHLEGTFKGEAKDKWYKVKMVNANRFIVTTIKAGEPVSSTLGESRYLSFALDDAGEEVEVKPEAEEAGEVDPVEKAE